MDIGKRVPGPVLSCPGPAQRRQEEPVPLTQLPSMLGPFDRFNVHATYWHRIGWTLELRHKHDREAYNCTHVVRLEGLSHEELVTAIETFIETGRERFSWVAEDCRCRPDSAL